MNPEIRQKLKYLAADYISANIAVFLFNVFRYYDKPLEIQELFSLEAFLLSPMVLLGQVIFPLFMLGVYYLAAGYDNMFRRPRTLELSMSLITSLVGTLVVFFTIVINDLTLERLRDYTMLFVLFVLLFLIVCVPRIVLAWRTNNRIWRGEIIFPAAIVGYGSASHLFLMQIGNVAKTTGVKPVMLIDAENKSDAGCKFENLPITNISEAPEPCCKNEISRFIVIPHPDGWHRTLEVINELFAFNLPIYIAAENLPPYIFNTRLQGLIEEPFIDVTLSKMSYSTLHIKRLFDVVFSVLALVVLFVPMMFAALAVKLDSRGSVFYRQRRVGLYGRQFNIIKLRTMISEAEADGKPRLSSPGDSRVTRIGRVFRKYRIDEIPQLINVLLGDMSIVGPRPERPEFIEEMRRRNPATTLISRVRPGLTSLGMVRYGYASDVDGMMRRLQYDLLYLENMSLLTDLKIILFTIHTVISGKGV